jgi:hypothetical protein
LPDGASPLSINCDYNLGVVFQRPGLESAFIYADFILKSPNAEEQTGVGAPWSADSVTLNSAPASDPQIINFFFLNSLVAGNAITYSNAGIPDLTGTPCVIVYPFVSKASTPPNANGAAGWIAGMSDNAGGVWSEFTAPTQATDTFGSSDPAQLFNYQYWVGVFANGLPSNFAWTITFNIPVSDFSTFTNPNRTAIFMEFATGVHKYAFDHISPTTGTVNSGAPITTTIASYVICTANIFSTSKTIPTGTGVLYPARGNDTISASYNGVFPSTTVPPATYNPVWTYSSFSTPGQDTLLSTVSIIPQSGGSGEPVSQTLQILNFGNPIPPNSDTNPPLTASACGCGCGFPNEIPVFGLEVLVTGSQTDLSPDAVLTVQLQLPDGTLSPTIFTIQLPSSPGTVVVGTPTETWGLELNATILNDPNFSVLLVATAPNGEQVTFTATVQVKVFVTPNPPPSINYLKTFAQQDGDVFSLALGSNGVMYREDVINDPLVLTAVYSAIEPDTFAESCTVDDREFIALSDLRVGTDIPYTYDGDNFDRLSQVGPGAPPTASTTTQSVDIVNITQPTVKSDVDNPGHLSGILWSAGPGSTAPGAVLTVYYTRVSSQPVADPDLQPGVGVTIAGVDVAGPNQDFNGQPVDGNYTVVAIGQGVPPGAEFERWYFTVTMPSVQSVNQADHETAHAPFGTYQVTTATLTTVQQVPNVEVGSNIAISGTGGAPPAGYDGTWQVTQTPNAAQLQITSTALSGNVATFGFNLITGTLPTVGQHVTVTGTLNGNGIFNVTQGLISSTSPGIFSIQITNADIPSAAESGSGIIFGNIFKFEPGQPVGTRTGGTLVTVGIIAAGVRKVCYSFLTRNGYMTAPSPIFTFDVVTGADSITIGNLLIGPPDVIARVVHITAANGGNFYDIPIPVTVLDNGVNVVNTSTYLNDNTSTSINLSFSDGVLLAATAVDVEGNNLFATLELGSVLGLIEYTSRVFAIGEQNKVPNFLNWSFDGGIVGGAGGITYPAGWTVDPTSGSGGSVVDSPIFGWAYQIANATGSTQATYGMITQPAFQDEFMVPIIQASTTYSTRITAMKSAGGASGNLVVDLFSPSFGTSLGSFSVPLASLDTRMEIFTGQMLVNKLAPVPNDLLLRIYATAIPDGTTILIDRNEVFPTEQPTLSTQVTGSYVNNFEAFDESGEGGVVDTAGENPQPVRSAFTLYDTLYLVKTGSLLSTQDNAATEPSGWSIRAVSNSVGTPSVYGVTTGIDEPNVGEAWAVIAGQPGGYIFNGGEPVKITEEIQSLWDFINWRYGHTLWVKNDVKERRLYFAVPMKTPNQWIPTGIIADDQNPTTPNVILMCSYRQLNTGSQLESRVGVHVSYSGRLIASEQTRKWSVWTIKAPAAAFLRRSDNTEPLFLGNSEHNGKIYELVDDWKQDDCHPIIQIYDTYGFVTDEEGQGLKIGTQRKVYTYAVTIVDGTGDLNIRVFPNSLTSTYAHDLLPKFTLPLMAEGDIEIPLNETANRLYFQYKTDAIGAAFALSRLVVATQQDPWSAVRGRNG